MDQRKLTLTTPALFALLLAACGSPSVPDEGQATRDYTEQSEVHASVPSKSASAQAANEMAKSEMAEPEMAEGPAVGVTAAAEPAPKAAPTRASENGRVVIDLTGKEPMKKPAADAAAAKVEPGTPEETAAAMAAEPTPMSGDAVAPPRLDTGYDLSKIRVPVTSPVVQPQRPTQPGVGEDGVPDMLAAPPAPTELTSIDFGAEGGEHDFGQMIQGDVREHAFRFTNGGEHDLALTQIKPSCGCTVAQTMLVGADGALTPYVLGSPIPPGQELELTAKLNTRGKHGPLQSNINLFGNVENNVASLRLKADVKTFLDIEPTNLNFDKMRTGEVKTGKFTVTSSIADRFKLEVDESLLPANRSPVGGLPPDAGNPNREEHDKTKEFNVALKPIEPDENGAASQWEVEVTVGPEAPEGNKSYPVRLFSDQLIEGAPAGPDGEPARHEVLAYVMAHVTGLVDIEPRYLSFGLLRPGQVVSKSVVVRSYDEGWAFPEPKVEVVGFRGEFEQLEYVSTSVKPLEEGSGWEVTLTVDGMPEDFNGSFRGKLVIETGNESKPRVEAPFSGVVRGGITQPQPPATPAMPATSGAAQPTTNPAAGTSPADAHEHDAHEHGGGEDE